MSDLTNSLEASISEKKILRASKIKLKEIHHLSLEELQKLLNTSRIRAMELRALSEFQSIPSIGIRFAHDLISLGLYSLADVKGKDPAKLLDRFEQQLGVWIDPCVEDQFRLVVHYANHPGKPANWWDFTNERKAFRQQYGYPPGRPKKAWHESDQHKKPG